MALLPTSVMKSRRLTFEPLVHQEQTRVSDDLTERCTGNCCIAIGARQRRQLRVTNGIVLEMLIGSLERPINGLACRSAEDARLAPKATVSSNMS